MKKILVVTGIIIIILTLLSIMSFGFLYKAIDISSSKNYYYNFFKNEIHYVPNGNWFELGDDKIEGVDIKTFKVLSEFYAKDKNNAYFNYIPIKNADVSTFEITPVREEGEFTMFAKDKKMLYYCGHSFEDIDVSLAHVIFEEKGYTWRVDDTKHIYIIDDEVYGQYGRQILKNGETSIIPFTNDDPKTFQFLNR